MVFSLAFQVLLCTALTVESTAFKRSAGIHASWAPRATRQQGAIDQLKSLRAGATGKVHNFAVRIDVTHNILHRRFKKLQALTTLTQFYQKLKHQIWLVCSCNLIEMCSHILTED